MTFSITENERRNELASLRDVKVVQANDLITSVAKMGKIPLKIFELAVAQIDIENPPENNTVTISKKQLFAFFNADDTDKSARFKEAVIELYKQSVFIADKENDKDDDVIINPLAKASWNKYKDDVHIKFTEEIMPYLINLKANFTQYAILDIMDFKSKYSVPIYKLLNMSYNKYEYYADKQLRTEKKLEEYQNPVISLADLRRITDTKKEYSYFGNFEKRVLRTAVDEINEHTHFNVSYKKIKDGRAIGFIQFFITKKRVAKNDFYKEEQQDKSYVEQQQQDEADFISAMRHEYTIKLLEHKLIEYSDMVGDEKTMLILYRAVYDKYRELELEGKLDQHLKYVKAHMKPYSKPNIAEYLRVSVEQYLVEIAHSK